MWASVCPQKVRSYSSASISKSITSRKPEMQVSTGFRRSIATNLSRVALHSYKFIHFLYSTPTTLPTQKCPHPSLDKTEWSLYRERWCLAEWQEAQAKGPATENAWHYLVAANEGGDNKFCLPSGDRHALRRNTAQPRMEGQDPHLKALSINVLRFNNPWQSLFTCGEPQFQVQPNTQIFSPQIPTA